MPEPKDPNSRGYNADPSRYSPEPPPASVGPVYLPMAERISKNFKAEYGGLDEIPVRYCQAEDLDDSLASLGALVMDLMALRAKHHFCRQMIDQYGIDGLDLWPKVKTTRHLPPDVERITVYLEADIGDSFLLGTWSDDVTQFPPFASLFHEGNPLGLVVDWPEIEAKSAAYVAGEWDGMDETWDHGTRAPIALAPAPAPPKPPRKRPTKPAPADPPPDKKPKRAPRKKKTDDPAASGGE